MAVASIVFDFDGTLVDSARGILSTLARVLRRRNLQPRVELQRGIVGPPLKQTLQLVSGSQDPGLLQALAADFRQDYDSQGYLDAEPYPDTTRSLVRLREHGLVLHIATNKRGVPTRKILDHLGWSSHFASVYCLDEHPADADKSAMLRRIVADRNIDVRRSLFVGDTPPDAIAARANAMPFLAVSWGYGSAADWDADTRFCGNPNALASAILLEFEPDTTCPVR